MSLPTPASPRAAEPNSHAATAGIDQVASSARIRSSNVAHMAGQGGNACRRRHGPG